MVWVDRAVAAVPEVGEVKAAPVASAVTEQRRERPSWNSALFKAVKAALADGAVMAVAVAAAKAESATMCMLWAPMGYSPAMA